MTQISIERRIEVDDEIAGEIRWLNRQGVITEGCCCGHGKEQPSAMIRPSSAKRARELDYIPWYCEDVGLYEIQLKGAINE